MTAEKPSPLKLLIENNVCLNLLVDKMDDINIADCDGKTALHYAAIYNRTELIQQLIDRGANLNVKDKAAKSFSQFFLFQGKTPLDYAREYQNPGTESECR